MREVRGDYECRFFVTRFSVVCQGKDIKMSITNINVFALMTKITGFHHNIGEIVCPSETRKSIPFTDNEDCRFETKSHVSVRVSSMKSPRVFLSLHSNQKLPAFSKIKAEQMIDLFDALEFVEQRKSKHSVQEVNLTYCFSTTDTFSYLFVFSIKSVLKK